MRPRADHVTFGAGAQRPIRAAGTAGAVGWRLRRKPRAARSLDPMTPTDPTGMTDRPAAGAEASTVPRTAARPGDGAGADDARSGGEPSALPPGLPSDWCFPRDLACPRCAYNLRMRREPRCPECGTSFRWEELLHVECPRCARRLTPQDREHCLGCDLPLRWEWLLGGAPAAAELYEYSTRPVRRGLATAFAVLRPRRFWKSFALEMTPQLRRLRTYRRVVLLVAACGVLAQAADDVYFVGYVFSVGGVGWASIVIRLDQSLLLAVTAAFAVPLLTRLILPRFTPTLTMYRVRPEQLARCLTYAYTGMAWVGLTLLLVGVVDCLELWQSLVAPRRFRWLWLTTVARPAALAIPAAAVASVAWFFTFLHAALARYLRLKPRDAAALVLSILLMTTLGATVLLVVGSIALWHAHAWLARIAWHAQYR